MSAPQRLSDGRGNVWVRQDDSGIGGLILLLLLVALVLTIIKLGLIVFLNLLALFIFTAPVVAVYCLTLGLPVHAYLRRRERLIREHGATPGVWPARFLALAAALVAFFPWMFVNVYVVPELLHLTRYWSVEGGPRPMSAEGHAVATVVHTLVWGIWTLYRLRIAERLRGARASQTMTRAPAYSHEAAARRRAYEAAKSGASRMAARRQPSPAPAAPAPALPALPELEEPARPRVSEPVSGASAPQANVHSPADEPPEEPPAPRFTRIG